MPAKTARNVYDPRVRELIRATGNPDLFPELNIPRSTISGWLRGDFKPAVGAEAVSQTEIELHARLAKLERRIQILVAVLRLLLALVRVSGCRLTGERLPTDQAKADILRAVDAARKTLPLRSAVRVLGLSLSRYHAWKQAERACDLADRGVLRPAVQRGPAAQRPERTDPRRGVLRARREHPRGAGDRQEGGPG